MVTDGMMDEWIEQQMDGPMDGPMDVQCFSLTQMRLSHDDFQTDLPIFTKALWINRQADEQMDGHTLI